MDLLSIIGASPPPQPQWRSRLADMVPDPEGAGGFADIAGRSREANAAAGIATAPIGALDYFGKTLRGEEPLRDLATGGFTDQAYGAAGTLAGLGVGGGMRFGRLPAPAVAEAGISSGPIRGYHASPYDFQRFDLGAIGKGEGFQTEGRGLYFAGNPDVMENYYLQFMGHPHIQEQNRLLRAQRAPSPMPEGLPPEFHDLHRAVWDTEPVRPTRYEVDIHADPQRFLDWEKPFEQQTAPVRRALEGMGIRSGPSGKQIYESLADTGGGQQAATEALRNAGIHGNQYLDAFSRMRGGGTHNRVVFDDKLVEILRKYGLLGPVAGGAAASALPGNDALPQQ